jgi:hypothetical protein
LLLVHKVINNTQAVLIYHGAGFAVKVDQKGLRVGGGVHVDMGELLGAGLVSVAQYHDNGSRPFASVCFDVLAGSVAPLAAYLDGLCKLSGRAWYALGVAENCPDVVRLFHCVWCVGPVKPGRAETPEKVKKKRNANKATALHPETPRLFRGYGAKGKRGGRLLLCGGLGDRGIHPQLCVHDQMCFHWPGLVLVRFLKGLQGCK